MKKLFKNSLVTGIIFLCLMSLSHSLFAQTPFLYQGSGGTFYVESGFLYQNGNIINDGQVKNKDSIIVTGNVSNSGTYTDSGYHIFTGASSQTISGTFTGVSYLYNLVRRQPTGISIFINDSVKVLNSISFGSSDGTINLDANSSNIWLTNYSYNSIINSGPTRSFNVGNNSGSVTKNIGDTVSGHIYLLALSNNGTYRGIMFQFKDLGTSGPQPITGMILGGDAGNIDYSSTRYCGVVGYDCISDDKVAITSSATDYIYKVNLVAETCDNGGSNPTRTSPASIYTNDFELEILTFIEGSADTSFCSTDSLSGPYNQIVANFAKLAKSQMVLPIELVLFTGHNENDINVLSWRTASEFNADKFEVYRTADNTADWTFIGSKPAVGGNTITNYTLNDYNPMIGNNYYMLKMLDKDGTFKYSNVINIPIAAGSFNSITGIYPNPASQNITVEIQSTKDGISAIQIYDVLGQVMTESEITLQKGMLTTSIDISNFAKGTYIVSFKDVSGMTHQKKFVKQ